MAFLAFSTKFDQVDVHINLDILLQSLMDYLGFSTNITNLAADLGPVLAFYVCLTKF